MKKRLAIASALLLLASIANAASTDQVGVSTVVAQSCGFTSPSFTGVIPPLIGEYAVGSMTFACNFVGGAIVNLNVPGGTNVRNGPNKAKYEIAWDIGPNGREYHTSTASALAFSEDFDATTGASPNLPVTGGVWVKLTQTPTVAGTYTSVATFTISP